MSLNNVDELFRLFAQIDGLADNAAGLVKPDQNSAEMTVDLALGKLGSSWGGDKPEFAARRQWLRSEILRRLPKVGRA